MPLTGWGEEPPTTPLIELEIRFVKASGALVQQMGAKTRMSAEERETFFAALNKSEAGLINTFRAVGTSGKATIVDSVRQLRYPTTYSFTDGKPFPRDFEGRNIGSEIFVEPTLVSATEISLKIEARYTEFLGFVEYIQPRNDSADIEESALKKLLKSPLKEGGVYSPVFLKSGIETTAGLASGQTLLLGGLDFEPVIESPGGVVQVSRKGTVDDPRIHIFVTARLLPGQQP